MSLNPDEVSKCAERELLDLALRIKPDLDEEDKAKIAAVSKLMPDIDKEAQGVTAIVISHSPSLEEVFLHIVPEANRSKLFHDALQSMDANRRAESLLARMKELNPTKADSFKAKRVAIDTVPFRLLCSRRSKILTEEKAEVPSFIALSYCWHGPDWSLAGNSTKEAWPISNIMIRTLFGSRQSEEEGIWIDQHCINQDDQEEKQVAIAAMDVIYRSARRVIVVLEDVALHWLEERTLQFFVKNYMENSNWKPDPLQTLVLTHAFYKIISARWFSRAWCAHEFRVGMFWKSDVNRVKFLAFSTQGAIVDIPLSFLILAYLYIAPQLLELSVVPREEYGTTAFQAEAIERWAYLTSPSPVQKSDGNESAIAEFAKVQLLNCTILSDRLAIATNLCGFAICYTGPIQTDAEAYWIFASITIASGDASVLGMRGRKLTMKTLENGAKFFSWLVFPTTDHMEARQLRYSDIHVHQFTLEWIELDIFILQESCSVPGQVAVTQANAFVDCCKRKGLLIFEGMAELDGADKLPEDQAWERFRDIFACVIECGIPWAIKAWHSKNATAEKVNYKRGLALRPWEIEDIRAPVLENLVGQETAMSEDDILTLLKFLKYLSKHEAIYDIERAAHVITSRSGDRGVTTFTDKKYTLAVPRCLPNVSSFPNGLWILERITTSETEIEDLSRAPLLDISPSSSNQSRANAGPWRLVGKAPLLGCSLICQDGEAVVLAEKQRIYGEIERV